MKIQQAFSHNAGAYEEVNVVQRRVLEALLAKITDRPKRLLDIGCGSGGVYRHIGWELQHFVGMDFAEGMLALHPRAEEVVLFNRDFNDRSSFEEVSNMAFDRIISSSALQWAADLDAVFGAIAALKAPVSLAIFTDNTFKTLYETASLPPLLRSRESVLSLARKHFHAEMEVMEETLHFPSVRDMFRYMKKSGVGAGRNILGYTQMRQLMERYPLDYLEYEIVLIHEEREQTAERSASALSAKKL